MKLGAILRLVAMILMAVTFAFLLIKYRVLPLPLCSMIVLGWLVIYIVFVVGSFTSDVDPELAQFWDIMGFGGFLGLGITLTLAHMDNTSDNNILLVISGILSITISIILLVDAIVS